MVRRYDGFMNDGKPVYLDLNKAAVIKEADYSKKSSAGTVWKITFLCEYGASEEYIVTPEDNLDKYLDKPEDKEYNPDGLLDITDDYTDLNNNHILDNMIMAGEI